MRKPGEATNARHDDIRAGRASGELETPPTGTGPGREGHEQQLRRAAWTSSVRTETLLQVQQRLRIQRKGVPRNKSMKASSIVE